MANGDFSIQVGIQLSDNGRELLTQWESLKKKISEDTIKINFSNDIQNALKPILQMSTEVTKLSSQIDNLNNRKININTNTKGFIEQIESLDLYKRSIEEVKKELSTLGNVRIKSSNIDSSGIKDFVAILSKANGQVAELQFKFNEQIGSIYKDGYSLKGIKSITDNTDKTINQLEKFKNQAQETLNSINNTGFADNNIFKNIQEQINNLNINNFKDKTNQINTALKELGIQTKNAEQSFNNITKFSNVNQEKINTLFSNDILPKDKIINVEAKVSGLQGNESQEYIKSLEVEINKLIEEEKLLIQENKNYESSIKETYNEQTRLIQYVTTQTERLKNIQSSYSNKLDINNTGYKELESEYNSITNILEKYRQENRELTVEEKTDITSRINDLKRLGNEYVSIDNFIKQQINTLNSLENKYKTVIDSFEVDNIKNKLGSLNPSSNNIVGDKNAITQQIKELEVLAKESQRLSNMGKLVGSSSDLNMGSSTKEIENFLKSTVSYKAQITSINEEIDTLGNRIKTVNYNIGNGNQIEKFRMSIDSSSGSVRNMSLGMNDLSSKHATFMESFNNALSGFIRFQIVAVGVMNAINELKKGFQEISEINKANINVAMITGDSVENVEKGNKGLLDLAESLKVVNSEVMNGQEAWMRSGVSQEEANKNLETTTKLSKIAGVANKDMADSLIVVKNAYDLNSQSLEGYASKVALLDNQSATSSEKINAAMQYSAETFKSVGVDMDTALSWITNFSEKSAMSGEAIGRGFRSMLTNFHKIQQGAKEGSEEEVQAVNKLETLLSSKGIALRKNKDEWIDLGTVVKNIQQNIGKFSDVEKSELSFRIGGKEQAEMTLSTLNNMKRIDELNSKLKEDSGAKSLNQSYEKYKQGIEAQLANLKNATTSFWMNVIDEKKVSGAIGVLTSLVKTLETLTTTSKTTGIAVIGLATSITVLTVSISKLGFAGVNAGLLSFFSTIANGGKSLLTFFQLLPSAMMEANGVSALLSTTFGGLATSIKGVTLAILSSPITWIAVALGVATYAVTKHIQHQNELKQQTDSLRSSFENLTQSMKDNNVEAMKNASTDLEKTQKILQDAINKKAELESKMKNNPMDWNVRVDSVELANANKTIEEQTKMLKDNGIAFDETTGKINKLTEAKSQVDYNKAVNDIKNETQATVDHNNKIASLIQEYQQLASSKDEDSAKTQRMSNLANELSGSIKGLTIVKDKDGNATISNTNLLSSQIGMLNKENETVQLNSKNKLDAVKKNQQYQIDETKMTYEQIQERIKMLKAEISAMNDADSGEVGKAKEYSILSQQLSKYQSASNAIDKIFNSTTNSVNTTTSALNEGYIPANDDAKKATKENTAAVNGAKDAVRDYENALKSLDNTIYSLESKMASMDDSSQSYRDGLNQEISLLQKKNEVLKNGIATNQQYAGSLGGMIGTDTSSSNVSTVSGSYTGSNYRDIINKASQTYGVDANLIAAVIQQESGFRNGETSYAGAQGLMQLMPGTARGLGVTNSFDPEQNIMGGTKYLKQMINQFGDIRTAVGHYNSGPAGNLTNSQTRDYMVKVMGYYQQFSGGKAIPTVSNGSTGSENSVASEMDSLQSKTEDWNRQMIENAKKIQELYNQVYESQMKAYDNQIEHVNRNKDMASTMYDLYKNNQSDNGVEEAEKQKSQIWKEINWRYSVLTQKENYINQQLQNTVYDEKTKASMITTLEQVRIEEKKAIVELHTEFDSWLQDRYDRNTKDEKDKIDILKSNMESLSSNGDYDKKISYGQKILEQQKKIRQSTIDEINSIRELYTNEKYEETRVLWLEEIEKRTKDLNQVEKDMIDTQNSIAESAKASLNVIDTAESKISEMIKKNVEEQKNAYDKDLDNFRNTIEKKKNLINEQYDAEDYQRKLVEENQKKQDIQTNINKLSLDSSPEAQAQVVELRKQLAEQQKNIDDMARQHERDERTKALDKQLSDQEKSTQNAKDNLDKQYSDEKVNIMAKQALQDGYFKDVKGNIQDLQTAMISYEDTWGKGLTSIGGMIKSELIDNLTQAKSLISQVPQLNDIINSSYSNSSSTGNSRTSQIRGTVYGSKVDLQNSKAYLSGLGYDFVDISDGGSYIAGANDIIVGGEQVTKNISNNGATRLAGADRYATEEQIKNYAKQLEESGHSYAGGGIITEPQFALLHANTPSDWEAVLNQPQLKGLTQNTIMETLSNLNLPDLLSNIQIPSILSNINFPSIPQLNTSNLGGDININIDNLIKFEGGMVEKSQFPSVQKLAGDVLNEIKSQLDRRGIVRQLGLSW